MKFKKPKKLKNLKKYRYLTSDESMALMYISHRTGGMGDKFGYTFSVPATPEGLTLFDQDLQEIKVKFPNIKTIARRFTYPKLPSHGLIEDYVVYNIRLYLPINP